MGLLRNSALALTATVVAAVPLAVAGCTSAGTTSSSPGHSTDSPTSKPPHQVRLKTNCGSSGCALVQVSRSLPPTTIFYGASCSGIHGDWFFNAVEGGSTTALRPSYALLWSFAAGATSAKLNARSIQVPTTKTTTVTITLSDGTIKLHGVRKPNVDVTATGSLVVKLSGSTSSPSLTFTETGLSAAEHKLGLVSPFDVAGQPLVVPIKHAKSLVGC